MNKIKKRGKGEKKNTRKRKKIENWENGKL